MCSILYRFTSTATQNIRKISSNSMFKVNSMLRLVVLTTAKPSPLECQLEEAGRENDSQEADAANKQPVWWSHETLCHLRQVLGKMNVKTARMVHNYMICFPHRASQVLRLIKHSRVHCTQLCIIHQAFLSMEDVFIIHTLQHFKLTHQKLVSKQHPLIGPCLFYQDHRHQQEHGTQDCRRILITSWPCRKM